MYEFFLLPTYILDDDVNTNLKRVTVKYPLPINCFITKFVVQ